MKHKHLLFSFLFSFLLAANSMTAQCKVQFLYQVSGYTVYFYDSSFISGQVNYSWNFGDGSSSSQKNPVHTYNSTGPFQVCLWASNGSCSDTFCTTVNLSGGGGNGCDATFQYSDSMGVYMFSGPDNSLGSPYKSYSWDLGDGSMDTSQYTAHRYFTQGSYTVCLTVTDSGCSNTYCTKVNYGGSNTGGCHADFSDSTGSGNTVYFINLSSGSSQAVYTWDFGDGNSSTSSGSTSHTYSSAGTYTVCMVMSDTGNCADSLCKNITIGTQNNCKSNFTHIVNSSNKYIIDFTDNSQFSGGSLPNYFWDFGDGNNSTSRNPSHTYNTQGKFTVCLTISDSARGCNDTYCTDVFAGNYYTISGLVSHGNIANSYAFGMVWIIRYDSAQSTLTAIDSILFKGGQYSVSVPAGYYLVKAALDSSDSLYTSYLPTYYNDKLHWDTAYLLNVNQNYTGINIHLIQGNNPGGPGFIAGKTSQGANKTDGTGDPVPHVLVLLLDGSDKPVAYTYAAKNGTFRFDNLALGTYKVYPEITGKATYPLQVTLTQHQQGTDQVVIEVNKFYSGVMLGLTSNQSPNASSLSIYPNPTHGNLNIYTKNASQLIYIYTLDGRLIHTEKIIQSGWNTMDCSFLKSGLYIIKSNSTDYIKLVIQ